MQEKRYARRVMQEEKSNAQEVRRDMQEKREE